MMEPGRNTLWDNSVVCGADTGPRFQQPPPPLKTPKVSRRTILMTHKVRVHQIAVPHYVDCNVGSGHSLELRYPSSVAVWGGRGNTNASFPTLCCCKPAAESRSSCMCLHCCMQESTVWSANPPIELHND